MCIYVREVLYKMLRIATYVDVWKMNFMYCMYVRMYVYVCMYVCMYGPVHVGP